jgi:hypothetical protein
MAALLLRELLARQPMLFLLFILLQIVVRDELPVFTVQLPA